MGCDIHTIAQKRDERGDWREVDGNFTDGSPFRQRNYGIFGFLANVRNYSAVTPLAAPRGLPPGVDEDDGNLGDHSYSWFLVSELTAVDYEQTIEDRRVTVQTSPNSWNGGCTCRPGEGKEMKLRDFLGPGFFADLAELERIGAERIVFGFDS